MIEHASSAALRCVERVAVRAQMGEFKRITSAVPWQDRFGMFRHNYAFKQRCVDAGLDSWFQSDPYQIADWCSLFTPIEYSLWHDIRCAGLGLWPQFPVGRFFVDFGNPEVKVAVECDGREFHLDKAKDARRDETLARMGWRVYRIPGWQCHGEKPDYDHSATQEEKAARLRYIEDRTPARLIRELQAVMG